MASLILRGLRAYLLDGARLGATRRDMSHNAYVLGFSAIMLAVGCAEDPAPASETGADEAAITATDGYRALAPAGGAVYQSVAVAGRVAFVGDNQNRIDVVDLDTMRKTATVAGRIPNDSLTTAGDRVIACGLRDDSPLDPYGHTPPDRSYVLTVIDGASRKATGEIKLHIEAFLASNPSLRSSGSIGFVDLPDLSCRFDATTSKMTVTFAQRELGREVVTFPLPASGTTHEWKSIPRAERTKIDAGGEATMKAAITSEAGITYAAGGWGLRQQAPGAARAKSLRDEDREHLVDLAQRGDHIYAVDNSNGLIITNLAGKTVERIEIPDWLHAIALAPSHVVVVGEKGLFVSKDRWAR